MGIPEEELQEEAPGVTFMQHSSQPPCMQAPPESGSGANLPPMHPEQARSRNLFKAMISGVITPECRSGLSHNQQRPWHKGCLGMRTQGPVLRNTAHLQQTLQWKMVCMDGDWCLF